MTSAWPPLFLGTLSCEYLDGAIGCTSHVCIHAATSGTVAGAAICALLRTGCCLLPILLLIESQIEPMLDGYDNIGCSQQRN